MNRLDFNDRDAFPSYDLQQDFVGVAMTLVILRKKRKGGAGKESGARTVQEQGGEHGIILLLILSYSCSQKRPGTA